MLFHRAAFVLSMIFFGVPTAAIGAINETDRNCVDRCIIEFAAGTGHPITTEQLDRTIALSGMPTNVAYRSLADCMSLLRLFNIPTAARQIRVSKQGGFPRLSIVFLPSLNPNDVGHVSVIRTDKDGRINVFDPASNPSQYVIKSTDILREITTIAIVPEEDATADFHVKFAQTFLIALSIVGVVYLWLRRNIGRNRGSSGIALLALGVLLTTVEGCGDSLSAAKEGIDVRPDVYDHGVINVASNAATVDDNITVKNNSRVRIVLTATVNCSCTLVPDWGQLGKELSPGEVISVPVSVRLNTKYGAFVEKVQFATKNGELPPREAIIKGIVSRSPTASVERIKLVGTSMQEASKTLEVVYVRVHDSDVSQLDSFVVNANDPEVAAQFVIGQPIRRSGADSGGRIADIWAVPIAFKGRHNSSQQEEATLEMKWSRPQCTTAVKLIGINQQDIDLPPKIFIEGGIVGRNIAKTLPIRINSPLDPSTISVVASKGVRCEILPEPWRLVIVVNPTVSGEFRHEVYCTVGDRFASSKCVIFGTAKEQ